MTVFFENWDTFYPASGHTDCQRERGNMSRYDLVRNDPLSLLVIKLKRLLASEPKTNVNVYSACLLKNLKTSLSTWVSKTNHTILW